MEFIIGADVSSLQAMEDNGAKYYDLEGQERDAIMILKYHGVNYIRLRIWNRPTTSFDGGDYCDLEHTITMAKRVKQAGLKLLLDFHYSDTWADWKCQKIPADWEGLGEKEIGDSIYRYTREVLERLAKEDAYPEMVQIGNEIGLGLLWDFGRLEHPETVASFLNRGISAVKDTEKQADQTEIMIHIECGGDAKRTRDFFTLLEEHGTTSYDVVGLSYYPYWAGEYGKLLETMRTIRETIGKPVVIAETAFPYTDESNDEMPNVVTEELTKQTMGLRATPENQRKVIEEIIELVRREENGYGIFYWEPVWYCIKGVGAMKGVGNEWENQAMFDREGRALTGLHAFESGNRQSR